MTCSPPTVSVVVPAYNRRDSLLALLTDLHAQEGVSFEIIVVDDHSPDDTSTAVSTHFPRVRLFRNAENGGPAVSRNRGVREARGSIIVGFDSDVTVPDRTLLSRVASIFAHQPQTTGLAFRIFQPDGRSDDVPRWWHPVPIEGNAGRQFETNYFSGTGYAFRREAMIAAGLFPEILYMHYEEVELAFRILDAGGTILHCPDLVVLHHAHQVSTRSKIKVFYKPRNQILLAIACLPWPRAIGYMIPRLAYNLLQALRGRYLPDYFSALGSARALAPARLATRRPLQPATFRRMAALSRQG